MLQTLRYCTLLLALAPAVSAATDPSAKTAYPPGPLPDRVVLTWSGDPATTQAVTWRTDGSVTGACAELQDATDGPLPAGGRRVAARTEPLQPGDGPAALAHTVEFGDLKPATTYSYRVGDGTRWSEWLQFRTARREPAPFTFLFLGDPQIEIRSQWSRVWRQAWLAAPHAAFALLTGDLINKGERDVEWGEWFEVVGWLGATRPLVLTPGSHEYVAPPGTVTTTKAATATAGSATSTTATSTATVVKKLTTHWRPQFALPTNGPAGLEETCYHFDYQGVRFVLLNPQEKRDVQVAWLRQALGSARPRWTVLAFHEPIFSGGRNRDNQKLRELWKPVIDELKVDLVLTGHDHVYARSGLAGVPTGYPAEREVVNGTVYVVSVSGAKMYEMSATDWAQRTAANTAAYQVITVDGGELRYRAETAAGRCFDAFTLRKSASGPNQLIEQLPAAGAPGAK